MTTISSDIKVAAKYFVDLKGQEKPKAQTRPDLVANKSKEGTWVDSVIDFFFPPVPTLTGCGVNEKPPIDDDGIIIIDLNPRVQGEGIRVVEDGKIIEITKSYLIKDLGNRVQEGGEIQIPAVNFSFPGAAGKTVKIVFECVPETTDESFAGLDGMIDVTPVAYHPDHSYHWKDDAQGDPIYIRNPFDANNRIPIYMGEVSFTDLTDKVEDRVEQVCTADDIYQESCDARINAAGSTDPAPYAYTVPEKSYENNEGSAEIGATIRVDATNYTEGHDYLLNLKIRMVME